MLGIIQIKGKFSIDSGLTNTADGKQAKLDTASYTWKYLFSVLKIEQAD